MRAAHSILRMNYTSLQGNKSFKKTQRGLVQVPHFWRLPNGICDACSNARGWPVQLRRSAGGGDGTAVKANSVTKASTALVVVKTGEAFSLVLNVSGAT